MFKLIMTKGLPASGKSTWAREYQATNPNTVRVNKDDLRLMLHNGVHSKGRESFVLWLRDQIVRKSLKEGHDVIVDDTNFNPVHEKVLREIAQELGANFEVQDFSDVPLEECLKRDYMRPTGRVGSTVIYKMWREYLKPITPSVDWSENKPNCVICDIDGTLALFGDKNPYNRDFENDQINPAVKSILIECGKPKYYTIFVSGRSDKFRAVTEKWLADHDLGDLPLFMRKEGDTRKDVIIKQEIYEQSIKDECNVLFVLDDRDQVVNLWRSLGLTCLQVAPGDF